ncbi:MAG TPA: ATP-binding protein, partial [Treponemataceae bacterium]|nr:ATP-binding protein [Treponemataceae bacterium]
PGGSFSTVEESLSIARDYFSIEALRWPGRFTMEECIDPAILHAKIPRLILQPLVENALVHGLEHKPGPGSLSVHGTLSGGDVFIRVRDSGSGIAPERLAHIRERLREAGERPVESSLNDSSIPVRPEGAGIALVNTHRRLCLMFGKPYGIEIVSEIGQGTTVMVCFPYQETEVPAYAQDNRS